MIFPWYGGYINMSNISYNFRGITPIVPYTILTYDKLKYENDWNSIIHTHPHCELLIVTHGEGYFSNGNDRTYIHQGFVVITNQFIPHTEYPYTKKADAQMEYVVFSLGNIHFTAADAHSASTDTSFIFDMSSVWPEMAGCIVRLDREIAATQPYWKTLCKNIIDELIILIMRKAGLNDFHITQSLPAQKITSLVEMAKNYMKRNYPFNITVDDLAAKVYINKYHLLHSFKKITGLSPMQYLTNVRINKAKALLLTTDFSITDIAMQTGFANTSHFCKKFKAVTGLSPMQFKKATPPEKFIKLIKIFIFTIKRSDLKSLRFFSILLFFCGDIGLSRLRMPGEYLFPRMLRFGNFD